MTATDAPHGPVLADHLLGWPAGRPVNVLPFRARKVPCDGCGKNKHCKLVTIWNVQNIDVVDLCDKCREWFIEEVRQ